MKQLQEKLLALLLMALLSGIGAYAQEAPDKQETPDKVVVFRFLPGEEMFSLKGNEAELERLYMLVDKHRAEITAGRMPVYVDGYSASLPTAKENLNTAFARANRVKSELITQKGLKEADFITANYARAYHNNKDLVVVTLRIPSAKATSETMPAQEKVKWEEPQQKQVTVEQKTEIAVEKPSEPSTVEQQPAPVSEQRIRETEKPYRFAVRTNLLYDALLLPTLGVEWRIMSMSALNSTVVSHGGAVAAAKCRKCGSSTPKCAGIFGIKSVSMQGYRAAMGSITYISICWAVSFQRIPAIRASCGMRD